LLKHNQNFCLVLKSNLASHLLLFSPQGQTEHFEVREDHDYERSTNSSWKNLK